MQNIIALLFCISALSIVIFMLTIIFQTGDKTEKVMSSCILIPLMIALMLIICGGIWEIIGT